MERIELGVSLGATDLQTPSIPPSLQERLGAMARLAWDLRPNAHLVAGGKTKVGCVALADDGRLFGGVNLQHRFRSHDVHAEVAAIAALKSAGGGKVTAIVLAAERELFTPCGGCMDWVMEFGGPDCIIGVQRGDDHPIRVYSAHQLMPYYPR